MEKQREPLHLFTEGSCEMFTQVQLEIMGYLIRGLDIKQIAKELNLAVSTVSSQKQHKIGEAFVEEGKSAFKAAIVYAVQNDLLPGLEELPDFSSQVLDQKEKLVLAYMTDGFGNQQICTSLQMRSRELKIVQNRIYGKLGVANEYAAIAVSVRKVKSLSPNLL